VKHLFTPQYPVLFNAPGPRCQQVKHRSDGRVSLQCVRRVHGFDQRHLMDVMDRDAVPGSRTAECGCGGGIVDLAHRELNDAHVHTDQHIAWVFAPRKKSDVR